MKRQCITYTLVNVLLCVVLVACPPGFVKARERCYRVPPARMSKWDNGAFDDLQVMMCDVTLSHDIS